MANIVNIVHRYRKVLWQSVLLRPKDPPNQFAAQLAPFNSIQESVLHLVCIEIIGRFTTIYPKMSVLNKSLKDVILGTINIRDKFTEVLIYGQPLKTNSKHFQALGR